jgi:hypothetical protein
MRTIIRNEKDKSDFILYVLNQKQGREYEATFRIHRKTRSLAANRYYWMILHCISDETGQDAGSLHDYFCKRYLEIKTEIVFDQEITIQGRTSKLNSQEFAKYIDCIKLQMNEQGIYLPEPGQIGYDEFELAYRDKPEGGL